MFAYCNNNPVNGADPNGNSFRSLLNNLKNAFRILSLYVKYGAPTSELGAAREYVPVSGSTNPNDPNCYAFSEGEGENDQPGKKAGLQPLDHFIVHSVDEVFFYVKQDQIEKGRSIRRLEGPDDPVFPNEYRVALRVGERLYYDPYYKKDCWDYHFMVQVSDGCWAEKHGYGGDSYCNPIGLNPGALPWNLGPYKNYYDSKIIYYAIGG